MANLFGWLLTFFFLISLLAIVSYQLMCFADLEFDYINPYDSAARINMVVMPEFITQAVFCLLCLMTGYPFMYIKKKHLVDVTEIYNQLNREKKQRLVKLGYLIILLVVFIFWLLWTVGNDDY